MTMSIPRRDPMTTSTDNITAGMDDPFDTALITRLANEFFAESHGGAQMRAAIPGTPPLAPAVPIARAGVPEALPGAPAPAVPTGIPAVPTGTPIDPELSGGYPLATPTAHPPVHSGLKAAPLPPPPTVASTPSGEHDPGSANAYPFGEPRWNGIVLGPRDLETPSNPAATEIPLVNNPANPNFPNTASSLPGYEVFTTPDFYFLRGS